MSRLIAAGERSDCSHCGDQVKFKARERNSQVICNVYLKGSWDHVEHFHASCYDDAQLPFGEPID